MEKTLLISYDISPDHTQKIIDRLDTTQRWEIAKKIFSGENIPLLTLLINEEIRNNWNQYEILLKFALRNSYVDLINFLTPSPLPVPAPFLRCAIGTRNIDVVRSAFELHHNNDYSRLIKYAVINNNIDAVKELLLRGVNINDPIEELVDALAETTCEMTEFLLANGLCVKDEIVLLPPCDPQQKVDLVIQYGGIVKWNVQFPTKGDSFWYKEGRTFFRMINGFFEFDHSKDEEDNRVPMTNMSRMVCDRLFVPWN